MAISANSVFETRVTGSDSNSGGFVSGASGVDYSQQDSAQYTFSDLASSNGTNATPSVTSSNHSFVSADVGNLIRITAGTSWTTGWFQIVSVSAGAAVLDRACGSSATLTSGSYVVGGALLSPAISASAATVAGNIVFVKAGTYSITSATNNIAAGCILMATGTVIIGYSTNRTRSNTDTKPLLQLSSVSAATIIASASTLAVNLSLDGASQTTSRGSLSTALRCKFQNFTSTGNTGISIGCEAVGCSAAAFAGAAFFCVAHGNSFGSFSSTAVWCIGYANTATPFGISAFSCIAYGNTGVSTDGFAKNTTGAVLFINCISESNGRYGFNTAASSGPNCLLYNCSHFGNGSGNNIGTALDVGTIASAATVFVDAANQDFRLNSATDGAANKGTGYSIFPGTNASMVSFPDIGAAQHQDSGSGTGSINIGISEILVASNI